VIILGLNAFHGDSSAALVRDGVLLAAAEEERFRRVKHWAGFPSDAVRSCLDMAGLDPWAVEHFAVARDPRAHLAKKALYALLHGPSIGLLRDRARNRRRVSDAATALADALGLPVDHVRSRPDRPRRWHRQGRQRESDQGRDRDGQR